jgi:hypothetical protein
MIVNDVKQRNDDQQRSFGWWLTGAPSGPVRVRTRSERVLKTLLTPDLEPDHWSGPSPAPNLGPNRGQVLLGSGSNHGSEPNLTIPSSPRQRLRLRHLSDIDRE